MSSRHGRRAASGWLLAIVALCLVVGPEQPTEAATTVSTTFNMSAGVNLRCSFIVDPLIFGAYDMTNPIDHDVDSSVTINCNVQGNRPTRALMGVGNNQTGGNNQDPYRNMSNGAGGLLHYGLFQDAARTDVWGNHNSTAVQPSGGSYPQTVPVHGRIPALQLVPLGNYLDTVVVTLSF